MRFKCFLDFLSLFKFSFKNIKYLEKMYGKQIQQWPWTKMLNVNGFRAFTDTIEMQQRLLVLQSITASESLTKQLLI